MCTIILIGCALFTCMGLTQAYFPPGAPRNVTLLADNRNIAVSWEPPTESDGNIRRYIVNWAILPNFEDVPFIINVSGTDRMSFIPVNDNVGRLFRIHVRAVNSYGIGGYSQPRYIRIGCGSDVKVLPRNDVIITSPGYDLKLPLKPGVICKWNIRTDPIYVLSFKVKEMNLLNSTEIGQIDRTNCAQILTYVNVSNVGLYCRAESVDQEITTQQSSIIVTLITGQLMGGQGFSLRFRTAVKHPGPPVTVRTRVNKHAIVVSWQPPVERTLPITSYIIHYKILPDGQTYRIVVAPVMTSFPINTDGWEGKLLLFNVTATIQDVIGETSSNVYARATCRHEYYLQPGQSINITSPNYPDVYPNSIVCSWNMRASPEATLRMTYFDFQLEDLPFCSSDYVTFSFKPEQECARMKVPHAYDTDQQEINVTLVTDNVHQFKGFFINIMAVQAFSSYYPGSSNTKSPLKYGNTDSPLQENLSTEVTEQGHSVHSTDFSELPPNTRRLSASQTEWQEPPGQKQISLTTIKPLLLYTQYTATGLTTYSKLPTVLPRDSMTSARNSLSSASTHISSFSRTFSSEHVGLHVTLTPASSAQALTSSSTTPRQLVSMLSLHSSFSLTTEKSSDVSKAFSTKSSLLQPQSTTDNALHRVTSDQNSFTKDIPKKAVTFEQTTEQTVNHSLSVHKNIIVSDKAGTSRHLVDTDTNKYAQKDDEDKSTTNILTPSLLSAGGCLVLVCIVVFLVCKRRRRRRKINVENIIKYRSGHIELHDILQDANDNVQDGHDGIFKTLSSRGMFGTTQSRKRHSTFPLCCSLRKRKVHREIQRQMAMFGSFIEDKEALETRLRRRHAHRRTSSF